MTLHRISDMSRDMIHRTSAASWNALTPEARHETLAYATQVEGDIRELVNRHNAALHTIVRRHSQVPAGHAIHDNDISAREAFVEHMEEIEMLASDKYMDMQPDDASHGLPENVAYLYNFAKSIHDQAVFLAFRADARHEENRHALATDAAHIVGHA